MCNFEIFGENEFSHTPEKRDWEYLKQPMLELLLLFYNQEDPTPTVLIDRLSPVMDTLFLWKQ